MREYSRSSLLWEHFHIPAFVVWKSFLFFCYSEGRWFRSLLVPTNFSTETVKCQTFLGKFWVYSRAYWKLQNLWPSGQLKRQLQKLVVQSPQWRKWKPYQMVQVGKSKSTQLPKCTTSQNSKIVHFSFRATWAKFRKNMQQQESIIEL